MANTGPPPGISRNRRWGSQVELWLCVFLVAIILMGILLGPVGPGVQKGAESAAMQTSRTIALAMFQYANDHNGNYPTGHSSTEVFQQLLDKNYLSDPAIFYVKMPGKTKPASKKLEPQNISWDVTVPIDYTSPDGLPVVFLTGYRINYEPNGKAVPLCTSSAVFPGQAVCYKSETAWFKKERADHSVENFIPADFDPRGQKFQQLTPDGPR